MKTFFLSVCGRMRRLCGGLAVRLKSVKKAVLRWLEGSAKPAAADCFASLGERGFRRAKLREALQSLASGVAVAAIAAFLFEKVSFWGFVVAILWSVGVWLYATKRE